MMPHSAFVAVVTGGAAVIGLAAARRFAQLGLRVCIADLGQDRLARAAAEIGMPSVENRPPLSRRHPGYADAFEAFSRKRR